MRQVFRKPFAIAILAGFFLMVPAVLTACSPTSIISTIQVEMSVGTIASIPTPVSASTPSPFSAPEPTTEIVCPTGDCAYTCLSNLKSFLDLPGQPLSPPKFIFPHQSRSPEMVTLVDYQVNGDQISSPILATDLPAELLPYQADTAAQQVIWAYFAKIIPADQRKGLKSYVIATDGVGNVLASMGFLTSELTEWKLSVDIVDAVDPTNMTYTLIHEFGHLLTLNRTQITPDIKLLEHPDDQQVRATETAACPQYLSLEGCSQPNSIINLFYQKFWVKLYPSWVTFNSENDPVKYDRLLGEFYLAHQDQFVTPYSVTSPEEDLAETWAHFIFGVKPTGNNIADQKILFFYGDPDLVKLRNQIVNNICLYASGK